MEGIPKSNFVHLLINLPISTLSNIFKKKKTFSSQWRYPLVNAKKSSFFFCIEEELNSSAGKIKAYARYIIDNSKLDLNNTMHH